MSTKDLLLKIMQIISSIKRMKNTGRRIKVKKALYSIARIKSKLKMAFVALVIPQEGQDKPKFSFIWHNPKLLSSENPKNSKVINNITYTIILINFNTLICFILLLNSKILVISTFLINYFILFNINNTICNCLAKLMVMRSKDKISFKLLHTLI